MRLQLHLALSVALFLSSGCDQAPLSFSSYSMPDSAKPGERQVSIEALLREGRYCADIRIAKGDDASIQETNEFFDGKLSVRYSVKFPNTGLSRDVDLGDFNPEEYGSLYEGGFAFHQFTIEVDGSNANRSKAYIDAVFEGDEELLEQAKLGINISEWKCK